MIEYELFMKLLLCLWCLGGISHIYLGAKGDKKDTHYGTDNIVHGVVLFLFVIMCINL